MIFAATAIMMLASCAANQMSQIFDSVQNLGVNTADDAMLDAFDDLAVHFEGKHSQYPRDYYQKLMQCLSNDDDDLMQSQRGAWQGMTDYWKSNGTSKDYMGLPDHWGQCIGRNDDRCFNTEYVEYNESKQEYVGRHKILIYEPCNHVSNLAFLHGATKICDYPNWSVSNQTQKDQKRAFASLAAGSAFFHGSHTYVGYVFDNQMIAIIAYIAHQSSIEFIAKDSEQLRYLQPQKRNQTTTEIVQDIVEAFYKEDVPTWGKVLNESDFPHDYLITFGAIVSTIFYLVFPAIIAQAILWPLTSLILPPEDAKFMTSIYLPEIRKATSKVDLPRQAKHSIISKFMGVLIKIVFAFLYQEKRLKVPGFRSPFVIDLGGHIIPWINSFADLLTLFPQTDQGVNDSISVYPGQDTCKFQQGHSIWHEVSANGFLDVIYMCDYIYYLTKEYNVDPEAAGDHHMAKVWGEK